MKMWMRKWSLPWIFALGGSAFTLIGFQSDKQGSALDVDLARAFALALQRLD